MRRRDNGARRHRCRVAVVAIALAGHARQRAQVRAKTQAGYKIFFLPKDNGDPRVHAERPRRQARGEGARATRSPTTARPRCQRRSAGAVHRHRRAGRATTRSSSRPPTRNAVAPALKRAAAKGVKVISYDADTAPDARTIFVAPTYELAHRGVAGRVDRHADRLQGRDRDPVGERRPRANQNTWIKFMKAALKKPKYKNMKLVKIAYGNDDPTDVGAGRRRRSSRRTRTSRASSRRPRWASRPLRRSSSRRASAARCKLTGLGLPNDMRKYVEGGLRR